MVAPDDPVKITVVPLLETLKRNPAPFFAASIVTCLTVLFLVYVNRGGKSAKKRRALCKPDKESFVATVASVDHPTHNTILVTFNLPSDCNCLGLGAGKHIGIVTGAKGTTQFDDGEEGEVRRSYTPVTTDLEQIEKHDGKQFQVLLKVYPVTSEFPKGGVQSQRLSKLKAGDTVKIVGPTGLMEYHGKGHITQMKKDLNVKHVTMVAGGTGITPMIQIIKTIIEGNLHGDKTTVSVLYANSSEDDVLLRSWLEAVAKMYPKQISVWFTVSQKPKRSDAWPYSVGRIDGALLKEHLPAGDAKKVALLCGPKPFEKVASQLLKDAGYDNIMVC